MAVVGMMMGLLMMAIQYIRESARIVHCTSHLAQIGHSLSNHHTAKTHLPHAVKWKGMGEPLGKGKNPPGTFDYVSLHKGTDKLYSNWIIEILPFMEEENVWTMFKRQSPIGDTIHEDARSIDIAVLKCPSDPHNDEDNHFQRDALVKDKGYARANYGMNGGTNKYCLTNNADPKKAAACKDGFTVIGQDMEKNTTAIWGSGIGGLNKTFNFGHFSNGISNTVAVEELMAGSHAIDRRGVWALGFPSSSITICHKEGPNSNVEDVINGCDEIYAIIGKSTIPCAAGINKHKRATARSHHKDGVHVLMADGSVHFINDEVESKVWDRMHRRDARDGDDLIDLNFE